MKTTNDYLNYWLEQVVRRNVRQSTYMAYRGYIENHIKDCIGIVLLSELKTEQLQEFVSALQAKCLASKTIHSIMQMIHNALKCAVDYEYITKNPCEKVRLPKLEEREITVFDKSDQKRLELAVEKSTDPRNYGVLICLYTGLRIGEVCGLKWECVDFKQKTLEIRNSLNRIITYDENEKKPRS